MMKKMPVTMLLAAVATIFSAGCAATYQKDCRILLESDPPGAEVWKELYYKGTTPLVLHFTATYEDISRGYLRIPPLTVRKPGYRPELLEMELDLKKSGDFWEAMNLDLKKSEDFWEAKVKLKLED